MPVPVSVTVPVCVPPSPPLLLWRGYPGSFVIELPGVKFAPLRAAAAPAASVVRAVPVFALVRAAPLITSDLGCTTGPTSLYVDLDTLSGRPCLSTFAGPRGLADRARDPSGPARGTPLSPLLPRVSV